MCSPEPTLPNPCRPAAPHRAPWRAPQACSALTLAPGAAALLTGLLLAGNSPAAGRAYLTPELFWVPLLAAFCDAAAALAGGLARERAGRARRGLPLY